MGDDIVNPLLSNSLTKLEGAEFFSKLLSTLVAIGIMVGGLIFVVMLVLGAAQWISSGGDKGQMEAARSRITQAVIGLVVLFAVFAIIKLAEAIFGVNILNIDLSGLKLETP